MCIAAEIGLNENLEEIYRCNVALQRQ